VAPCKGCEKKRTQPTEVKEKFEEGRREGEGVDSGEGKTRQAPANLVQLMEWTVFRNEPSPMKRKKSGETTGGGTGSPNSKEV